MVEVSLRDHLDAHPLESAEVTCCQLLGKAHLLTSEEQRDEDVARRKPERIGADEMVIETGTWIAGFDLPKPAHAHAKFARQFALRQAQLLPCLFNLPSRYHFDVQDRTFSVNRRRTGTPDRRPKGTPLWRWRASTLGAPFALLAA